DVDHDDIVNLVGLFEIFARVEIADLGAGIVERSLMPLRKMELARFDDLLIDVDHEDLADRVVAKDFAEGGAFAPSDDEYLFRMWMGEHRRMNQRLVVDEFVHFAGLHLPVEDQTPAIALGV